MSKGDDDTGRERTGEQKHVEIPLLLERRAPVPRAREAPVDAAPRVVEVVRAAAVEGMPEKVAKDVEVERVERPVLGVDVCAQRGRVVQRRQLRERIADRQEDAVDLRVLVYVYVYSRGYGEWVSWRCVSERTTA